MNNDFEKIFDAIDDIVLIIDNHHNIERINYKGLQFLGRNKDQIIGRKCHLIFWNNDAPCNFCPFSKSRISGKAESVEKLFPGQKDRWFSIKSSPLTDSSGNIQGFVDILRDISYQKVTEERLKESNEEYLAVNEELLQTNLELSTAKELAEESELEFRELFENMSQGFALHEIIVNEQNSPVDYKFIHINRAFEKINQINASDYIGKRVREVIPNIESHWIENYGEVALTGKPIQFESYSKIFNKYYDVLAYSPRKGYFAVIFTDITENKKHEQELRLAKEEAQNSNRLKSAFLANMSHEIRSPMNAIIGFSEMINNPGISEEKRVRFTKIINHTSYQLLNIVNDILDISKIESGNIDIISKPLCINQVFTEAVQLFSPEAIKKGILLTYDLPLDDSQAMIMGDKLRIRQILDNIIKNAIKFTDQGKIEIGYKTLSDKIEFYVKDTGIGIKEENIDKIFDRFWQESIDFKTNKGGTGLGLSICKSLVEKMQGEIWVESVVKKGTLFTFSLPYIPAEQELKGKRVPLPFNSARKQLPKIMNLLIAEDDEVNFLFLKELLQNRSINIIRAENGLKAVEACQSNVPDLVIMDVKMPRMGGIQAMQEIKKHTPDIPVIALTAHAMKEDKEQFEKCGFDEYLSKPVNTKKLLNLIDSYR